jgi:hypothetical protein
MTTLVSYIVLVLFKRRDLGLLSWFIFILDAHLLMIFLLVSLKINELIMLIKMHLYKLVSVDF